MKQLIFKINKEADIFVSMKIKKEQIKSVVEELNEIDSNNFYFHIKYEDDFLEYLFQYKKNIKEILKEKKNNLNNINKKIKIEFKNFDLSKQYRILVCERFSNIVKSTQWSEKESIKIIIEKIKNENKSYIRNIKIYEIENLKQRYERIYDRKNRDEEYYLERETFIDNLIEEKIFNKKSIEGELKDKEINFNEIQTDFLNHLFEKIKIKSNLKYTIKQEEWDGERAVIETIIPVYDKKLLSVEEQKSIINRVFPSMQYVNNFFYNVEILKDKPSLFNINNHKLEIIISILNKTKSSGFNVTEEHYKKMEIAIQNHNLTSLLNLKLKKGKMTII